MVKRWLGMALGLLVAACSETGPVAPKEGRISIYQNPTEVVSASGEVAIGSSEAVTAWISNYANAHNNRPQGAISLSVQPAWETSVGSGLSEDNSVLVSPIVVRDMIYTLDSRFRLQATRLSDGKKMWRKELPVSEKVAVKSVGLAYRDNRLFAVAGDGHIMALDMTGKPVWEKDTGAALRAGPVIVGNRLFVTTLKNDVLAFKVKDGSADWTQNGQAAVTTFLGMATPAATRQVVVVPTTTGLVNAYEADSGVLLWTETMWSSRTFNPIQDLPHMTASPVMDGKTVYLIGNAGKTGAYRIADGRRLWAKPLSGRVTPVVSGQTLFMINNDNQLVAVNVRTGTVDRQQDLPGGYDVVWQSPILAGGYVIAVSSAGDVLWLDAVTGIQKRHDTTDGLAVPPIVVQNKLILLTKKGDLHLYQ